MLLPKGGMKLHLYLEIANVENVLYVKLSDDSDFMVDKIVRRVATSKELEPNEDLYLFEPKIYKNKLLLQLFVPEIYLYNGKYETEISLAYKRDGRVLMDHIELVLAREKYYVSANKKDHEIPSFTTLSQFCKNPDAKAPNGLDEEIKKLNTNRVDKKFITKLENLCKHSK